MLYPPFALFYPLHTTFSVHLAPPTHLSYLSFRAAGSLAPGEDRKVAHTADDVVRYGVALSFTSEVGLVGDTCHPHEKASVRGF